jgi:hypothetical protein
MKNKRKTGAAGRQPSPSGRKLINKVIHRHFESQKTLPDEIFVEKFLEST